MDSQHSQQNILNKEINQGNLKLGYYADRGRVAMIKNGSKLLNELKNNPNQSTGSQAAFLMMNWLIGKSRLPNNHLNNFILSAVEKETLSQLHPSHNLFIDRFDSPHHWREGDKRSAQQLADALLPSGQWHRHYDTVILPSDATNEQIQLIRHWLALTGGSVLILHDEAISPSAAVIQLMDEIMPIQSKNDDIQNIHENYQPEIQAGIAVYTNHKNQLIQIAQLAHLQEYSTNLPPQPSKTEWIFKTFIKIPKDGDFTFVADTNENSGDIQFEVGSNNVTFKKQTKIGWIRLNDLKAGEIYPVKITTKTNGTPPRLRLGWGMPNSQQLTFIPQDAFLSQVHQPISNNQSPVEFKQQRDIRQLNQLITGFQQVISLPATSINQIHLTEQLVKDAEYFSITIENKIHEPLLELDDIPLSKNTTWRQLAQNIEKHINQQISPAFRPISVHYDNGILNLSGEGVFFTQFQLKKNQTIPYIDKVIPIITEQKQYPDYAITQYRMNIELEKLNQFTHLTMISKDSDNRDINLIQRAFKLPNTQFDSPEQFASYLNGYLRRCDYALSVTWDEQKQQLVITDSLNRKREKLSFGYQEQILPIAITENRLEMANKLTLGEITGQLPQHTDIKAYQLLENAKSGDLSFNQITGEWHYQPHVNKPFVGFDQFDFIATLKDGSQSAPISIQLQTENAPIVSYPGKRTFRMADPIYHEPIARHYPIPCDMRLNMISLTQAHEQPINSKYLTLIENRWALIKVDLTSSTEAYAPDITAIVRDFWGNILGKVQLSGPDRLPKQRQALPIQPTVDGKIANQNSYTAPLKGCWLKPGISIQLFINDQPFVNHLTDYNGYFSPEVIPESQLTAHITNHTLYQKGQGLYAYSPMSWGLEAAAKLPISQITLYNTPAEAISPPLFGFTHPNLSNSTLNMPQYDKPNPLLSFPHQQIDWALQQSEMRYKASPHQTELFYTAIEPTDTDSRLGIAFPFYGGGIAQPDIMWHEVFGHGLKLPHTTDPSYPYSNSHNGLHVAYDQSKQTYITYQSLEDDQKQNYEVKPAMYPAFDFEYKAPYHAFIPHSSYYNWKIQHRVDKFPAQNKQSTDTPIYWISGHIFTLANGQNHPYNHIEVRKTIGDISDTTRIIPTDWDPYTSREERIAVTYATDKGLITEDHFIKSLDTISVNIPDKGELVKIEFLTHKNQVMHTYKNPDALANRLLSQWDKAQLIFDDYWHGGKLFWSVTEPQSIDFPTDKINQQNITQNSILCAKWVQDGQCYQQYFSLSDPWGATNHVNNITLEHTFIPLNHLSLQADKMVRPFKQSIEVNMPLLSDVYINQTIDISALQLPEKEHNYWATLLVENTQGEIVEQTPIEQWQITRQDNQLTVIGTIDSTPELTINAMKIYIDQHLQDEIPPHSITLTQPVQPNMRENRAYLEYDRPMVFNTIARQSELIAGMPAQEYSCTTHMQRCPQTTSCHFFAPPCQI
ncbi:hypothetical protein [Providencia sneebia]|uniref:Uncharacterized protein n=1 Tax=Providencia sneebia DSM 19967 TaxID=1141660 RepID=K8WL18_9GAMM|nr:hypothetical protein [Providencia sneebia]EKT61249.1 hypothetical protein OO7_01051 [Providencia sneebia DSM 19967]